VDPGDFAINGPVFGAVVPEPTTRSLVALALVVGAALGGARRRRMREC